MFFTKLKLINTSIFAIFIITSTVQANDKNLKLRVERIERMLEQQMKSSLLVRLNQLQKENQQLRSLLEEQSYQNEKMKKRFDSLFNDLDSRISGIEKPGSGETNNSKIKLPSVDNAETITKSIPKILPPLPTNRNRETDNSGIDTNENKQALSEHVVDTREEQTLDTTQLSKIEEEEQLFNIQQTYKKAFNELKSSKYAKAEQSFTEFLNRYPNNIYTDIAQYWLAETNYIQRNFTNAIQNYQKIKTSSGKYKESKLKIAYCYYELKNRKKAKDIANQLIQQYPKSSEAKQAKYLLKQIK
ncbi:MAG: tetratricopeptide repeat protein [Gammaproteobacteria bacterium]|nr:tetratricopeptide repeat protein [Gammaproteobacteria bacterium]